MKPISNVDTYCEALFEWRVWAAAMKVVVRQRTGRDSH